MLNRKGWSSILNSLIKKILYFLYLKKFVTLTTMENLRWTPTLSTWHCRKKTSKTLFYPKNETSGMQCVREIAGTISLPCNRKLLSQNVLQHTHKKHDKREPGPVKEEFRCTEMFCLCSKTYCCYDRKSKKYQFSSEGLNKRTLED